MSQMGAMIFTRKPHREGLRMAQRDNAMETPDLFAIGVLAACGLWAAAMLYLQRRL
jgi:hypothetical protein